MKKIDAHAHIGEIGGWANVAATPQQLLELMDMYEMILSWRWQSTIRFLSVFTADIHPIPFPGVLRFSQSAFPMSR